MFNKSENREDYQATKRAVAAMARDLPNQLLIPPHSHDRAQLIYGCSGVITVMTNEGSWVVPPHRAVWVPARAEHATKGSGLVELRTIYVDARICAGLPQCCSVIEVGPLLRELILAAVKIPNDYLINSREDRIMKLILDEIRPAPILPLKLPMPTDKRALRVCEAILESPGQGASLAEFGQQSGASGRTLERVFRTETGMSFTCWRQQARLLAGIRMLALGDKIGTVAQSVGYESPSAFSLMFRRALGVTPSQYFGLEGKANK